ncbi:MAG: hypothetical protein C0475_02645 [Planctomyces sp.]|nr:hypothetical protein [Planctomyces sp.]
MTDLRCDALILGGGIAGLWALARLRNQGLGAALLSRGPLGAGQTLWSQGIIHGGVKYTLGRAAGRAARAIAPMPGLWRDALAGRGPVPLPGARTLSDHQIMWTTPGLGSRVFAAAAGAALRAGVDRLSGQRRPAWLAGSPAGVHAYAVPEPIVDVPSVIAELARAHAPALGLIDRVASIDPESGAVVAVDHLGRSASVRAGLIVLAAGAGNPALLDACAPPVPDPPRMQRRPLHMVMAFDAPADVHGHCIGMGTTPRLTVTTATRATGQRVWCLGGTLAEHGVGRPAQEHADTARRELHACLPWLDLSGLRLRTGTIDRAEGFTPDGSRPDEPTITAHKRLLTVWPTKLAFAPLVAERVLASALALRSPSGPDLAACDPQRAGLLAPPLGTPPWDQEPTP